MQVPIRQTLVTELGRVSDEKLVVAAETLQCKPKLLLIQLFMQCCLCKYQINKVSFVPKLSVRSVRKSLQLCKVAHEADDHYPHHNITNFITLSLK